MSKQEEEVRNHWFMYLPPFVSCDACGEKEHQYFTWHEFLDMNYTCSDCYVPILEKEIAIAMKKFPELPNNKKTREALFDIALNGLWDCCDKEGIEEVVFEYVDELTSPNE